MISDALDAFAEMFSPPFRKVLWKSLGLTAAFLIVAGVALDRIALAYMHLATGWLGAILSALVAVGLFVGLIFLAPPTASLVAGFYLDDIAALVEGSIDPRGSPGRPLPLGRALLIGARFAVLSLIVNIVVLTLTLFTGVGLVAFFVLNGYLLGREYFELAAMRHMSAAEARALFDRRWLEAFAAGALVAVLAAVPLLNVLTPLFATALLTRVYKRLA
jgi:CysZ protein